MPNPICLVAHVIICCVLAVASLCHGEYADFVKFIAYLTLAFVVLQELICNRQHGPSVNDEGEEGKGDDHSEG